MDTWQKVSSPTRSAVRKAALFGRPIGGPAIASISSILSSIASMWAMVFMMAYMPILFATKFGVSLPYTMPLPRTRSPNSAMRSIIFLSVSSPGMISRSFMWRTGLKKCVTKKCFFISAGISFDISVIGNPEVFDVTNMPGFQYLATCLKTPCLIFMSSLTTSITQSQSAIFSMSSSKLPI